MKNIISFAIVFISITAFAYIPNSSFVFDRVADLHGRGNYKITMDVVFKQGAETQTVKEVWTISENGDMMVQAYGGNFKLTRLIKKNRVYWQPEGGNQAIQEISVDSYMPILFDRSALDLKRTFVRWGAIPPDALKDKKAPKELTDIKVESEPFVRLGRVNGAVQFAYGEPDKPGVWIQQDQFFITKLKTPSGADITSQDFAVYAKNLAFPKTQTIKFGPNQVEIKVTGLSGVEQLSKEEKARMEPGYWRSKPDYATSWPKSTLTDTMQDFYKRFR